MHGVGVKGFKAHPIKALFEVASRIDASLSNLNIMPHQRIPIEASVSRHLKKFSIPTFMNDLERHGSPDNRYNAFGVDYNTGHLFAMDSLSFQLRRKIGAIPINESFKKLSPDLILIFEKNNPWFHANENHPYDQIPNDLFHIQYSFDVTKLEFLLKNENNPAYKLALQWLRAKMKLPTTSSKSS